MRASKICFQFIVGLLGFVGAISATMQKPLWADEIFGIQQVDRTPFWNMFWGIDSQASANPLYYLQEKFLSFLFNFSSSSLHSLFSYRFGSAIDLSLLLMVVFGFVFNWSSESSIQKKSKHIWILSLTAVLMVFQSRFIQYYAVEARPYMLWILFCFLQLHSTLETADGKNVDRKFALASIGLAFTTGAGLFQFFSSLLTLSYLKRLSRPTLLMQIPAAIVFAYYALQNRAFQYPTPTVVEWIRSLLSVFRETLGSPEHILSDLVLVVFLGLNVLRLLRSKNSREKCLALMALLTFFYTLPLFLLLKNKGYFVTPRQFSYFVPILFYLAFDTILFFIAKIETRMKAGRAIWLALGLSILSWQSVRVYGLFQNPYWQTLYSAQRSELCNLQIDFDDGVLKKRIDECHQKLSELKLRSE